MMYIYIVLVEPWFAVPLDIVVGWNLNQVTFFFFLFADL